MKEITKLLGKGEDEEGDIYINCEALIRITIEIITILKKADGFVASEIAELVKECNNMCE